MTAAASPNKGDWAWPLKPPSPPLELQFLPPSSAAAAASSEARSPPASPWTVDPSRLQKLMMGSIAAPPTSSASPSTSIGGRSSQVPDFGAFFDPGINKSLPSGWERCLDLKSGEVFIKKCDTRTNGAGVLPAQSGHCLMQGKDWNQAGSRRRGRAAESVLQIDEQRLDWSLRWMQGKSAGSTDKAMNSNLGFSKTDARLYGEEGKPSSLDGQPLCLDLDLRLTSDNSSRLASETSDTACLRSSKPPCSTPGSRDASSQSKVQPWKWEQFARCDERPASIQEMVSESTMATAVCSKCLMYVLLKKSNPTCPRCFNPIILDCGIQPPLVNKRPRLELSPDDLSLSTDSSR